MYVNHTLLKLPEAKVLDAFLDLKRHYFAELLKVTKLTRPRTLRALKKLVKQEILEVKSEANVKYYSCKRNAMVYSTLGLIEYNRTLLFLAKNKTITRALQMLKEGYDGYFIMLIFGSVVKGYATKTSDVDLLVIKDNVAQSEVKKIESIIDLINGRTGLKISPYLMRLEEFEKKNDLAKQVIADHILIDGAELFFKVVLV